MKWHRCVHEYLASSLLEEFHLGLSIVKDPFFAFSFTFAFTFFNRGFRLICMSFGLFRLHLIVQVLVGLGADLGFAALLSLVRDLSLVGCLTTI